MSFVISYPLAKLIPMLDYLKRKKAVDIDRSRPKSLS